MSTNVNSLANIFSKGVRDDNGCLVLTSSLNTSGYPLVSYQGKKHPAHRLVYRLHYGQVPRNKDVHHTCYNRACIELSHLEVVTHQENIIRTERYEILRELRLHILLAMYPQIEFFPITVTSVQLSSLWGCQSYNVPKILQTMTEAYPPAAFVWRPLRKGRQGRKPALFEVQLASSLVEKLLLEPQETLPTVAAFVG